MTRLTQSWRLAYRYAAAVALIALCLPSLRIFQVAVRHALAMQIVPTPRGNVAPVVNTAQRGVPELLAPIAATPPGDVYFFYPYDAMLPFLSGREHVSKYGLFAPGYTTPAQYAEACRSVMRDTSWVVVDRLLEDPKEWTRIFPSMPDAKPQERASKPWTAPSN